MPKMINGDAVFSQITAIMDECTAKQFKSSEDTAVALSMLKRCAQIILDAPAEEISLLHCEDCKQWGRIESVLNTPYTKLCAVGGYMTGPKGFCHFGRAKE